jgi:hypothetical protein
MKLKMKFLLISIVIFSVSFLSISMQAQGIYSKNKDSGDEDGLYSRELRGGAPSSAPPMGDPGSGGQDSEPGKNTPPVPIGEGWLFLTVLSVGYAVLQKRKTKKQV